MEIFKEFAHKPYLLIPASWWDSSPADHSYQLLGSIGGHDDDLVQGELINLLHCSEDAGHKMDCA